MASRVTFSSFVAPIRAWQLLCNTPEQVRGSERVRESEDFIREFGDVADDAPYLRKVIKAQKDEDFMRGFNGDD